MSWTTFWAPFLISSVGGGALSTAVGIVVGFLIRRWLKPLLGLEEIRELAQKSVDQSTHAAARATGAEEQSKRATASAAAAGNNSKQAGEALVEVARHLAERDTVIDELKERVDRLLGTRARQLAAEHQPTRPGLIVPLTAGDDTDPTTTTGRHRLHTQRIPTIDEGDHP